MTDILSNIEKQLNIELGKVIDVTENQTQKYKQLLVDKLSGIVLNMNLNPDHEKPSVIKAKTELLKVFNDSLNNIEIGYRENTRLLQKQNDSQEAAAVDKEVVKTFIKLMIEDNTTGKDLLNNAIKTEQAIGISSTEQIDKELNEVYDQSDLTINDAELKTNPKDIDIEKLLSDE